MDHYCQKDKNKTIQYNGIMHPNLMRPLTSGNEFPFKSCHVRVFLVLKIKPKKQWTCKCGALLRMLTSCISVIYADLLTEECIAYLPSGSVENGKRALCIPKQMRAHFIRTPHAYIFYRNVSHA